MAILISKAFKDKQRLPRRFVVLGTKDRVEQPVGILTATNAGIRIFIQGTTIPCHRIKSKYPTRPFPDDCWAMRFDVDARFPETLEFDLAVYNGYGAPADIIATRDDYRSKLTFSKDGQRSFKSERSDKTSADKSVITPDVNSTIDRNDGLLAVGFLEGSDVDLDVTPVTGTTVDDANPAKDPLSPDFTGADPSSGLWFAYWSSGSLLGGLDPAAAYTGLLTIVYYPSSYYETVPVTIT